MPKISAPTVAEHRVRQRDALLQAAIELLVSGGVSAVTPAAVSAAAGLARPSFYQYFSSGAGILAAVIEDAFPRANAALMDALKSADGPVEELDTYVRVSLRLAHDGAHRPAAALSAAQLPDECRARLRELHQEQAAPFMRALTELGAPDLQLTARLLGGVLEAAMGAIESGASLSVVTARTLTMVHAAAGVPANPPESDVDARGSGLEPALATSWPPPCSGTAH